MSASFSSGAALFNSIRKRKSISKLAEINAYEGRGLHFLGDRSPFRREGAQGDTSVRASDACNNRPIFQSKCSYDVYVKNNRL